MDVLFRENVDEVVVARIRWKEMWVKSAVGAARPVGRKVRWEKTSLVLDTDVGPRKDKDNL